MPDLQSKRYEYYIMEGGALSPQEYRKGRVMNEFSVVRKTTSRQTHFKVEKAKEVNKTVVKITDNN